MNACDEVSGTKRPIDPWSEHIGFFNTLGAVFRTGPNKGKRSYAATEYFDPNAHRTNLKVLCEALVNKINLDGQQAVGVNFAHHGRQYDVHAKREVIVCGGVVKSPQILELSGIGDPDVLKAAGVECKIENRAVGNNFQDHAMSWFSYQLRPGYESLDVLSRPGRIEAAMEQLAETKGGILTMVASMHGFLPFKSCCSDEELKETIEMIERTPASSEFYKL